MPKKTGLGKKKQAEQTRGRILDAAIALFAKRGFASTSTQDIARAIGMTPGVLYWHFSDKEAILAAVLDELQRRLFTALTREEERVTTGARGERAPSTSDTLRALIGRVARVMRENPENLLLVGVIAAEATDTNPRIEKALREAYARIADVARDLLERAAAEGAIVDVDIACASEMFLGLFQGAVLHQRLFRAELPLERALPVIERMLFAALVPEEGARAMAAARAQSRRPARR